MANHFSALKRARQTEKRTANNRLNKSRLRTELRKLRASIAAGDRQQADTALRAAISTLDKSVQKGVLHKNTVARKLSRLSARIKAL